MNSFSQDPHRPVMMSGFDESQMVDTDPTAAPLDSAFFDSAFAADGNFLDEHALFSSAYSPLPKEENGPSRAEYRDNTMGKQLSPESPGQDSASDSSGQRRGLASLRNSQSPRNFPPDAASLVNTWSVMDNSTAPTRNMGKQEHRRRVSLSARKLHRGAGHGYRQLC